MLLITVEGAPATTFSPWGGPDARLDPLAAQGATWLRAYAPSPQLQPNLATVLTGLDIARHGMRLDGTQVLPAHSSTLFEELKAAGWHTSSSTGTVLTTERWGLHQGIQDVFSHMEPTSAPLPDETVVDRVQVTQAAQATWLHVHADGLDAALQRTEAWREAHADGWIVLVGVTGRGDGLDLNDDALRLPLIVVGPGYLPGTTHDDVVGLVDVAGTLRNELGIATRDVPLLEGGPQTVRHEAHAGRAALGTATLQGTTDQDGRYVVGQYASWHGVLGQRIPPTGHVVSDTHPAAERFRVHASSQSRTVPENAWLPQSERLAFAEQAPLSLADPDAPSGITDPRDRGPDVAVLQAAIEALSQHRYSDALRIAGDLEGTPAGTHIRALAARGRADFDAAATALDQGHATSPGFTWAWHRAELEVDRCRLEDATEWLDVATERTLESPETLLLLLRAIHMNPLPVGLDAIGERIASSEPGSPLSQVYRDPTNTTYLPVRPMSASIESIRARAAWQRGHASQAIERQRQGVTLDPFSCPTRTALARWLLETGDLMAAQRLLAPMIRTTPDEPVLNDLWERSQVTEGERHDRRADRVHNRP
jgi:hypothetical protein